MNRSGKYHAVVVIRHREGIKVYELMVPYDKDKHFGKLREEVQTLAVQKAREVDDLKEISIENTSIYIPPNNTHS